MIKNKKNLIANGKTAKQRKVRHDLLDILEEVISGINPEKVVKKSVSLKKNKLIIENKIFDLNKYENIYIVGAGKATYFMARALEDILGKKISKGLINIPEILGKKLKYIDIKIASHPIPDRGGVLGAKKIVKILEKANKDDLVITLISGGGSALMPLPVRGVSLGDKIKISKLLVTSRAPIEEINTVRKHISQIKGGQMAKMAYPASIVALYISDVVGDRLDTIASGPTVSDKSTFQDAINILKKYKIWSKTPISIKKHLNLGTKKKDLETPKNDNKMFRTNKVYNYIIGGNKKALDVACRKINKIGYNCHILTSSLEGEAHNAAKTLLSQALKVKKYNKLAKKPAILIAGGETILDLKGDGFGGRNQELVMAGVSLLKEGITLVSFATDGVDGQTPDSVAGAMADLSTLEKCLSKKVNINKYLENNDSYKFFKGLDELIKTGYTGINVGDIVMIAII
jgi:glycerate-2-kinase